MVLGNWIFPGPILTPCLVSLLPLTLSGPDQRNQCPQVVLPPQGSCVKTNVQILRRFIPTSRLTVQFVSFQT
ncbi:hypothetical protein GE09DRAFT_1140050 [Coniochaeta sp. 2T2.1]|nr:hypothetical protein GE09DRAFT_1140050 [Coniochaeta sp. 2T2.1]